MTRPMGDQLSSEEHGRQGLVRYAETAEQHGFSYATISDHCHSWIDAQGHSPFVWSVLGAISRARKDLELGTWVTCPTTRHPTVPARRAAADERVSPARRILKPWRGSASGFVRSGACSLDVQARQEPILPPSWW